METKQHTKIKRKKVANRKTLKNRIKKRLSSEYWKANALILTIFLVLCTIIGYYILSLPAPKSLNNEDSYNQDRKKMEMTIKEQEKRKQQ